MWREINRLLRMTMQFILDNPLIFWACVGANLVGAVVGGWFWYGPMLLRSPWWALPFIPDCPLAALLGSIGLLALRYGRRWNWFFALTAFACIKYGLWTVAYWLNAWTVDGFRGDPIEVMLFVSHIGLLCEGLLFIPYIAPLRVLSRLSVIGVFVLSIFVDYGLGFYPPLGPVDRDFAMWTAIVLTAMLGAGLLALPAQQQRYVPRVKTSETMGLAE